MTNSNLPHSGTRTSNTLLPVPQLTTHFSGRRLPSGECEVARLFRFDGEKGTEDHVLPIGWRGRDALYLAVEMLWLSRGCIDGDVPAWFAAEVLQRLPEEGWELSEAAVRKWSETLQARHSALLPPRAASDAEAEEEDRVLRMKKKLEKLRALGILDENYREVRGTEGGKQ